MPVSPTAPGVYIQEISSGSISIAGVSTSTAAFIGPAARGPFNVATRLAGWGDYVTNFGGFSAASELSYAVSQFFANGGSDAWVVRVGANANTAQLATSAAFPYVSPTVLTFTAFDGGFAGNGISIAIYHSENKQPAGDPNRFDVVISGIPSPGGAPPVEAYTGVSMNSRDGSFVEKAINGRSGLVTVKRAAGLTFGNGSSQNAPPATMPTITTPLQMTVAVDGVLFPVVIGSTAGAITPAEIQSSIENAIPGSIASVTVSGSAVKITSKNPPADYSSVIVYPGPSGQDAASALGFGKINGGIEIDGSSSVRPGQSPLPASLALAAGSLKFPLGTAGNVALSLDGAVRPILVALAAGDTEAAFLTKLNAAVNSRPGLANSYFKATEDSTGNITIASGTRGAGSLVRIANASAADTTAQTLGLLTGTLTSGGTQILSGGSETPIDPGNPSPVYFPDPLTKTGTYALENVPIFNILCLPGVSDATTVQDASTYCEQRRAFYIIDPPPGDTPAQIQALVTGGTLGTSDHAAIYYPYINITDPLTGQLRPTAPSGTVAGLYAATDSARGIWKAPAGTNAALRGALALEYAVSDAESGYLNPVAINAIRNLTPHGIVAWGARTMHGNDANPSDYKYVPVRRLALYIEQSLLRGTQWVVFEPNDATLWGEVRKSISSFMDTLFRQGAFAGSSPREAYFVKCDADTNPQSQIALGILNIVVGFAPVDPAEFVIITIQQIAGQSPT
jgi:phage tail sheath protein FI